MDAGHSIEIEDPRGRVPPILLAHCSCGWTGPARIGGESSSRSAALRPRHPRFRLGCDYGEIRNLVWRLRSSTGPAGILRVAVGAEHGGELLDIEASSLDP